MGKSSKGGRESGSTNWLFEIRASVQRLEVADGFCICIHLIVSEICVQAEENAMGMSSGLRPPGRQMQTIGGSEGSEMRDETRDER